MSGVDVILAAVGHLARRCRAATPHESAYYEDSIKRELRGRVLVGKLEWEAINRRVEVLQAIEEAASELVEPPFGQLSERSFYRLREALDA